MSVMDLPMRQQIVFMPNLKKSVIAFVKRVTLNKLKNSKIQKIRKTHVKVPNKKPPSKMNGGF